MTCCATEGFFRQQNPYLYYKITPDEDLPNRESLLRQVERIPIWGAISGAILMPIYMPTCMPMHMSLHTPTQVLHTCGYGYFCTHVYMHVLSQAAEDGVHDFHMEYAGLQVLHERGFLTLNKLE